jgi:N-acetylmuramic acid 6-phosphate etherase
MPSSRARSPRERAQEFLETAGDFRLGDLVTERSHPRSADLSRMAQQDTAAGLAVLFDVDRDVVATYAAWARSDSPARLAGAVLAALRRGRRVFFTGCGATGRLAIQLDALWRAFWQARAASGRTTPAPEAWEDRTRSVMAGGDYALVKSVEGFEDFAPFGERQLAEAGVAEGDVVFALTEGGETSFVLGTAWQGLAAGAEVFLVYDNPDDVLCAHVRRSRELLAEPRLGRVNLTTGPMAIAGSTRMQATSIQLLAMLTVLEMVLRDLLASEGALEASLGPCAGVPEAMSAALEALHAELSSGPVRAALARLCEVEERIYRGGARTSYLAGALGVDVLTDTTERSPTFGTPAFRKWDDPGAPASWTFLFTTAATTEEAWPRLLGRAPRTVEWTEETWSALAGQGALPGPAPPAIGLHELMRFRIGLDGLAYRPIRPGDGLTAVVAEPDLALVEGRDARVAAVLASARAAGAATAVIGVGRPAFLGRLEALTRDDGPGLSLAVPEAPFLLDPLARVGVKMLLNALSTCVMVRLGRVLGNRMVWVVPGNLKLIDRATRIVRDLAGVSYEDACVALFEVMDHLEPRRRAGQASPAPVVVAVLHLRDGLSLPEAEARAGFDAGALASPAERPTLPR